MNPNRFQITVSPLDRTTKVKDFRTERLLINGSNSSSVTQKELMNLVVAPHSRTWSNMIFEGSSKTENFKSLQVVALDFDNKPEDVEQPLLPKDVVERCKKYGCDVSFIYSSFSHTEEQPRYRAVWVLDSIITDSTVAKNAINTLYGLFPEADKVLDLARIWLGGKDILYSADEYVIPYFKLLELGYLQKVAGAGNNAARAGKGYLKKNSIPLYNSIEQSNKSSLQSYYETEDKVMNYNYEYARQYSTLLNDLLNAEVKIWHNDLLLLASNLFRIEGGMKLYKKKVRENPAICNTKIGIMSYIKHRWEVDSPIFPISFNVLPSSNPDAHLSSKYNNLLEIRPHTQYDKAILINPAPEGYALNDARNLLKEEFEAAIAADDNSIYLFKCATGLGKTSLAINQEEVAIFFPTHDLKQEQAEKSKINPICTHNLADYDIPDELMAQYTNWCSVGQFKYANYLISDYIKNAKVSLGDSLQLLRYNAQYQVCNTSDKTIFGTHSKGIYKDYEKKSTYIFDEDPINTLFQINKCSTADLRIVAGILQQHGNQADAHMIENLVTQIDNGISLFNIDIKSIVFDDNSSVEAAIMEYHKRAKNNNNIFGLLFSENPYFTIKCKDKDDPKGDKIIYYINYKRFNENKKYIILSATVNEAMYKQLYGERVKFIDISNVQEKGQVVQFSDKSFARSSIRKQLGSHKQRINIANTFKAQLPVIGFKESKNIFDNAVTELHFGKCEGSNILTGQDLKVVGTPHCNPIAIELMSKVLGIKTSSKDFDFRKQKIQHNGYEFTIVTSDNLNVRTIQFYYIERELVQAIGRARLLDNNCTVYLFSDYPIPNAEQNKLRDIKRLVAA